jgi:hypothetical protein
MTNYFFISSPLHFLFSVNMAIRHRGEHNVAVITSFIPRNAQLLADVIRQDNTVFDDVLSFNQFSQLSKTAQRKARLKLLSSYLQAHPAARLYTGTDRNVEFQYAMYCARKQNPAVQGIYLDEGTQTYLGNKRMHKLQHRYIDPLLKKLRFGWWWKNPLIIGTSGWIDLVYAAFPHLVHPLFAGKTIQPFDSRYFNDPACSRIAGLLLEKVQLNEHLLSNIDCVVLLTHDSFYQDAGQHINQLMQAVSTQFAQQRVAIKAHPRSRMLEQLKLDYPAATHLDNRIGFELMLPLFPASCVFVGDVSSTLFTVKWFKPRQSVYAVKIVQVSPAHFAAPLQQLFQNVDIQQLSYQQLPAALAAGKAAQSDSE